MAGQPHNGSPLNLESKKIVLGVTGGISAYKSVEVLRRLMQAGATVWPVMSENAQSFVGKTTLSALASEPARVSLFDGGDTEISHTRLGQEADLVLLCPATANTIAKYTHGIADDLLTNTLIATRAPVVIAAAMHTEMWEHPAVVHNVGVLTGRGVTFVGPASGPLAGGDIGFGRLAEPEDIVAAVGQVLNAQSSEQSQRGAQASQAETRSTSPGSLADLVSLRDKHVLISAGGTREPIDPVRYIGNHSTGRQGHAFALVAAQNGAQVTLVTTAPNSVYTDIDVRTRRNIERNIDIHAVSSADEMYKAIKAHQNSAEIVVMAAAVADFTPVQISENKIKKADGFTKIELRRTVDILAELGAQKRVGQKLVGFAAETADVEANGLKKLRQKNLDMVVINDVTEEGAGFASPTNIVTIIEVDSEPIRLPKLDKLAVAHEVLSQLLH